MAQETRVRQVFEKLKSTDGRLDILVNVAAGSVHRHALAEFPLDHRQTVIDANLTSTFLCCRGAVSLKEAPRRNRLETKKPEVSITVRLLN